MAESNGAGVKVGELRVLSFKLSSRLKGIGLLRFFGAYLRRLARMDACFKLYMASTPLGLVYSMLATVSCLREVPDRSTKGRQAQTHAAKALPPDWPVSVCACISAQYSSLLQLPF